MALSYYDPSFMSVQIPQKVDPWRAAGLGLHFAGALGAGDFKRIPTPGQILGPVRVGLVFSAGDFGQARIGLDVCADFAWTCQRCLEPMQWRQTVTRSLLLVDPGSRASQTAVTIATQEDEELEAIPVRAGEFVNLYELIEDELLLALPFAPTHEHCESTITVSEVRLESRGNPFAELANLSPHKPRK